MKRTAKYYSKNPDARKKKLKYDKDFQKRPEQVKKRVEANKANRKAGTYGNGDGKDYDHAVGRMGMGRSTIAYYYLWHKSQKKIGGLQNINTFTSTICITRQARSMWGSLWRR